MGWRSPPTFLHSTTKCMPRCEGSCKNQCKSNVGCVAGAACVVCGTFYVTTMALLSGVPPSPALSSPLMPRASQAMHCTDDYWGVKRCIEKYRAGNMASTGKPEGCSLCTACKASPYGLWDCEHDGVRVMMPVDSTTCPSYAAIPKSSYP